MSSGGGTQGPGPGGGTQLPTRRTRSAARKAILVRILTEVIGLEDDDGLVKALDGAGIRSMSDLLALTDLQAENLTYPDASGVQKSVPLNQRNMIKILKAWNVQLLNLHSLRKVDWSDATMITEEEWDEYRVSSYDPDDTSSRKSNPSIPSPTKSSFGVPYGSTLGVPSTLTSLTYAFRKGIRRDKSHYSELKDEANWDEWKRATLSTASSHGVENIFNPNYKATNADEFGLFLE